MKLGDMISKMEEQDFRSRMVVRTNTALEQHGINIFEITSEFQKGYKAYNQRNYGVDSLRFLDNRTYLVMKREYDRAVEILTEHGISEPDKYLLRD